MTSNASPQISMSRSIPRVVPGSVRGSPSPPERSSRTENAAAGEAGRLPSVVFDPGPIFPFLLLNRVRSGSRRVFPNQVTRRVCRVRVTLGDDEGTGA